MNIDLEKNLLPPPELVTDGSSSLATFISVGASFRKLFETHLALRSDMRVLEMGSAVGRIARQFVNILSPQGSYTGIEIMPAPVAWCTENISRLCPWFHFIHADIYNAEYNPNGVLKADAYRFPFDDAALDLVILTSVFTHMLRRDMAHYLKEIQRVLKPGASCFSTFFSFTREELPRIAGGDATPRFQFPVYKEKGVPVVVCADPDSLEEAVAYEKSYLERAIADSGLRIHEDLPGSWLKREQPLFSYQDVLILRK